MKNNEKKVLEYIEYAKSRSDLDRTELNKEKTGIFTGAYAINPVNQKKVPIWISDYVLASYGTGALLWLFRPMTNAIMNLLASLILKLCRLLKAIFQKRLFEADGIHINSDFLNGLNNEEAINKMIDYL